MDGKRRKWELGIKVTILGFEREDEKVLEMVDFVCWMALCLCIEKTLREERGRGKRPSASAGPIISLL